MQYLDFVFAVVGFFRDHWLEVGVALGYIVAAARTIVLLTPSVEDDHALAKVVSVLKKIGLHLD